MKEKVVNMQNDICLKSLTLKVELQNLQILQTYIILKSNIQSLNSPEFMFEFSSS